VDHFEVEPLGVPLGVHIIFKPQVVLHVVYLDGTPEVATFKPRIKDQDVFLLWHIDSVGVGGLAAYGITTTACLIEVSLRCELGEVLEQILVELILKVTLSWLFEEKLVCPANFLLTEKPVKIYSLRWILLIIMLEN
jgi:hypothetical protein